MLPWRKAIPINGEGSIAKIPELLHEEGIKKPLIVTDPGLMSAGVAHQVLDVLDEAGVNYALYNEVESNPSVNTVNKIRFIYNEERCDSFIAIGGGSSMDAAKGAAARVVRPGRTVNQMGGLMRVRTKIPPFFAVPTTSGTGSETTIAALITDTDTHHRYAIMDLCLIPKYAVLDPNLTKDLPANITAMTGMDALTHAVEAYLCWTCNTKESISFALEATRLIFENLERAYKNGNDLDARLQMMIASYKAGFAFTRAGIGNVHAIAHTIGGIYNTAHGLANAVILPIVIENYGEPVYGKLARLAEAAGIAAVGSEDGSDEKKAKAFIAEIRAMNKRMGIPKGFDFIQEKDIPQMITWALAEANPIYPVPVIFDRVRCRIVIEKVRS
ncbi:MAG: iron-containing alcohol dehydrogenase [Clostridiales Family XIII bacterium]|nr:iron-containing alcohol dehydrogenase [Clostridiales Family XIII bacterium]